MSNKLAFVTLMWFWSCWDQLVNETEMKQKFKCSLKPNVLNVPNAPNVKLLYEHEEIKYSVCHFWYQGTLMRFRLLCFIKVKNIEIWWRDLPIGVNLSMFSIAFMILQCFQSISRWREIISFWFHKTLWSHLMRYEISI